MIRRWLPYLSLVLVLPAVAIGYIAGRGSVQVKSRDVIVSQESERVIAFTGAATTVAQEARTEHVVKWQWRTERRPDGTIIQTTTAKEADKKEARSSTREAKTTLRQEQRDTLRSETRERAVGAGGRLGLSVLAGLDVAYRRHWGVTADYRLLGPVTVGAWVMNPHRTDRVFGLSLGVRF